MTEAMRWFPFYVDRFLTSKRVRRMNAEQVGVYFLLLCEQWDNGAISDDDEDLCLVTRTEIAVTRAVLEACFKLQRKGWVNATLEDVRKEQRTKVQRMKEAASRAGRKSGRVRAKKAADAKTTKNNDLERTFNGRSTGVARTLNGNEQNRLEENRIEERTSTTTSTSTEVAPKKRATRARWVFCPDGWHPTDAHAALAQRLHVDLEAEVEKFRVHEFKNPRSDPDRAFSAWLRRAPQYANGNGSGHHARPKKRRRVAKDGTILTP